jgi:hypothetical protein
MMNSEGVTGLAWRAGDGKDARQLLNFAGSIIYPAVIR